MVGQKYFKGVGQTYTKYKINNLENFRGAFAPPLSCGSVEDEVKLFRLDHD